jgi:hypothetical protein
LSETKEVIRDRVITKLNGYLLDAEIQKEPKPWMDYIAYLHGIMTAPVPLGIRFDEQLRFWTKIEERNEQTR